jgi:hypothetical protein
MKKPLLAAGLLIMWHGFGLAQSTITRGDTNIEAAADGGNGNLLVAQQVALSQTATIQSLSFYVTTASGNLRLGIYDASGPSGAPKVLKAQTRALRHRSGWGGSANGVTVGSAPATNLCSAGTASAVTGNGPWNWSCAGNGGTTATRPHPDSIKWAANERVPKDVIAFLLGN